MLLSVLGACKSNSSVPIVENQGKTSYSSSQSEPATLPTGGNYRVRRGDTLYSISFNYGMDWRVLARANNIGAPYTIVPGQELRIAPSPSSPDVTPISNGVTSTPSRPASGTKIAEVPSGTPFGGKSLGSGNKVSSPSTTTPPTGATPLPVTPTPPTPPMTASLTSQPSPSGWVWPTSGTVISSFSGVGGLNKGIDIAGQEGQPVVAGSSGTVVYTGNGLPGYGELIIIKHNESYFSAYGHNRKLLVREGQQVKTGQTIAEMGSTSAERVKLHFEIRKEGKPVDPMHYLPRR